MKFMLSDHRLHSFRGQRESEWKLESSMTRTLKTNPILANRGVLAETATIKLFQKNAHLYDNNYKHFKESDFAKLTYIQHHGAPTRLLDLTSSKYIALFFAFDGVDMSSRGKYVRIWYFDNRELRNKTKELSSIAEDVDISENPEIIWSDFVQGNTNDSLFVLTPSINSKRSHIQQGSFICSGNIQKSVHEIYKNHYREIIHFVDINKSLMYEVHKLLRDVNLSHSTLYGGIDGYAKDVSNRLLLIR